MKIGIMRVLTGKGKNRFVLRQIICSVFSCSLIFLINSLFFLAAAVVVVVVVFARTTMLCMTRS